jgi:Domain of unknown function (DUF4280)
MPGPIVVNGASIKCTFGATPSPLTVPPIARVTASSQPAATIMDSAPGANISPFGLCLSPANPQVIAATAAALGVFTPQPCIPVIPAPWAPGSPTVMVGGKPALTVTSTCQCTWAGTIAVMANPNMTVQA